MKKKDKHSIVDFLLSIGPSVGTRSPIDQEDTEALELNSKEVAGYNILAKAFDVPEVKP